jgi:hypothetical protein
VIAGFGEPTRGEFAHRFLEFVARPESGAAQRRRDRLWTEIKAA